MAGLLHTWCKQGARPVHTFPSHLSDRLAHQGHVWRAPAAACCRMGSNKLNPKQLKSNIGNALWQLEQLEVTVKDFQGDQSLLEQRLDGYLKGLTTLQQNSGDADVHIPQEVVQCVDEGRHPDAWTSEAFRRVNRANQAVKGKTDDLKTYWQAMLAEAEKAFPEEAQAFLAKPANPTKQD